MAQGIEPIRTERITIERIAGRLENLPGLVKIWKYSLKRSLDIIDRNGSGVYSKNR